MPPKFEVATKIGQNDRLVIFYQSNIFFYTNVSIFWLITLPSPLFLIGRIRKRALLNHFGSARAVESASLDDLKAIEGIEDNIANKIYNYFHE